ncbi:MAG: ABC transporter permease [Burkholderiaceae bacterium]
MSTSWKLAAALLAAGLTLLAGAARADEEPSPCGPLRPPGQYGPYDNRKDLDKLSIVLGAHFLPYIEDLSRGNTSSTAGGDIDYTLRAIPNNPRALIAMMRLGEKEKKQQPQGARYTVECYFERAIRFAPDDLVVRMIYANFLINAGRNGEAAAQLDSVARNTTDNPFTHYNLGLIYFDLKDYDKSLHHAQIAYALGFQQPALRDKLQGAGRWVEPPADAASAALAAAADAASAPAGR